MLWKKMLSFTQWIKNEHKDELWLFAIILVMLLLAMAGLTDWNKPRETVAPQTQQLSQSVSSIATSNTTSKEISSKQVQAIINKPIADLMAMQVYDNESRAQGTYELVAQASVDKYALQNRAKQPSTPLYLSAADPVTPQRIN